MSLATLTAYVFMENTVDVKAIFLSYFILYLLKTPFQSLLHLFAYFVEASSILSHCFFLLRNFDVLIYEFLLLTVPCIYKKGAKVFRDGRTRKLTDDKRFGW